MGFLRIKRKAHHRKSFIKDVKRGSGIKLKRLKGTKVKATSFLIKDRGAKGRSKKVLPSLKRGSLGVRFSDSIRKRRMIESSLAKRIGEKKVVGKLRAVQILNKKTNPEVSRKARKDASFISKHFKRKKRIRL